MNSLQLLLSSNSCPINICASLVVQTVQRQSTIGGPVFHPWVRKIPWKRKWQPTPVLMPGKSHGLGALWATVHLVSKSLTRLSDSTTPPQAHISETVLIPIPLCPIEGHKRKWKFPISYKTVKLLFLNCVSTNTL